MDKTSPTPERKLFGTDGVRGVANIEPMTTETAILAGGCFWGAQQLLRRRPGVISTRVGYSGDDSTPNATYRNHGDHAEAVEIVGLYWHFVDVVWLLLFVFVYWV